MTESPKHPTPTILYYHEYHEYNVGITEDAKQKEIVESRNWELQR
jgi:hypothetical protein